MDLTKSLFPSHSDFHSFETHETVYAKNEFDVIEVLKENKNQIKILRCHLIFESRKLTLIQNLAKLAESKQQRLFKKYKELQEKVQIMEMGLESHQKNIETIQDNILTEHISKKEMYGRLDEAVSMHKKKSAELNLTQERLTEQEQIKMRQHEFIARLESLCFGPRPSANETEQTINACQSNDVTLDCCATISEDKTALNLEFLKKKYEENKFLIGSLKDELQNIKAEITEKRILVESQGDLYDQKIKEYRCLEQRHNLLTLEWENDLQKTLKEKVIQLVEDKYTLKNHTNEKAFFGEEIISKWEKAQELKDNALQERHASEKTIETSIIEIAQQRNTIEELEERLAATAAQCLKSIEEQQSAFEAKCDKLRQKKILHFDLYNQSNNNLESMIKT